MPSSPWRAVRALLLALLSAAARAGAPQPVALQLKWRNQFQFAGYYAALQQGYFAQEGLDVKLLPGAAGLDPVREVVEGRAQYGIGDSELLLARAQGRPVVVIAAVFQHSPYVLLTRRADGLLHPQDFPGHSIMCEEDQGAAQVRAMFRREGVDLSRIRFRKHSWDLRDLAEGRVDAMTAYGSVEPYRLKALGVEPAVLRPGDYGLDFYGDCLFTTESELARHPERVEALRRAALKGWDFAMQQPEQVIPWILALPGARESGLDEGALRFEAAAMKPLVLPDIVPVGHINPARWQRILEEYQSLGLLTRDASLDGFLYEPGPRGPSRAQRLLLWAAGLLLALVLVALAWNIALRRRVRERTASLLQERELLKLARHAVNQAGDLVSWLGADGRYLFANETALRRYGRSLEEMLRLHVWDIVPNLDAQSWPSRWAELKAQGQSRYTSERRGPDGSCFPVEVASTFLVFGDREVLCNIARDLSEQRRAEAEREAQRRKLQVVLEGSRVGCWEWDLDSGAMAIDATVQAFLGYGPGELPASSAAWSERLHPEDRERVFATLESFLDHDDGLCDLEFRLRRRPGDWLWVNVRGRVTRRNQQGRAAYLMGTVQDVTEREQLKAQFLRAQRMESIGTLAGGIAHDLNNVLTPILMSLDMVLPRVEDAKLRRTLQVVKDSAVRGKELIQQVLSFSRGVDGRRVPVDPAGLLRDLERIIAETFPRAIQIRLDLEPGLPPILGDPTQLNQVLLNFCVNARDAMPDGGVLTLGARAYRGSRPGRWVQLWVEDTGQGIPKEAQEKIFEPFFTTKEVGKGTGLGLSTVLGIVRSHGGSIELWSEEGRGTRFEVLLPADPDLEALPGQESLAELPRGRGELVLVVDDEEAIREITRQTLEAFGYQVLAASNGRQAVALFEAQRGEIAAVLTDMMMPLMDGLATIRALKALDPALRIAAASGLGTEEMVAGARELGVTSFLEKPYTGAAVLGALRELLDGPA